MTHPDPTAVHPPKWNGATYARHRARECRCRLTRYGGSRLRRACHIPGTIEHRAVCQLARQTAALTQRRLTSKTKEARS